MCATKISTYSINMNRFKDILDCILDKIEQISDSISKKGVQSKENVCKTILEDKDFGELFQEMRNFLGEISERKFEEKLTNFVVTTYRPEAENEINRIKEIMRKDIFSQLNPVIKFVLFFILFTYHRRFTNISKLEELFREYEYKVLEEPQCDYFKNKVEQEIIERYMKHLKAMYLALTGKSHQIIKALKIIKEVLNDNNKNSLKHEGIVHNYVWILTTCLEDDECYVYSVPIKN